MRRSILAVCILVLCGACAWASTKDVLKVDYFANANATGAPDATVRVTNPGTSAGNICAYIEVFDPNQELGECCACLLTPDGLLTLSVDSDLTSNPLSGVTLQTGSIQIFSVVPVANTCPLPGQSGSGSQVVKPSIRAWATHIQNGSFAVTESAFQDATLSATEESNAYNECYAIVVDGSGSGICTCGSGD